MSSKIQCQVSEILLTVLRSGRQSTAPEFRLHMFLSAPGAAPAAADSAKVDEAAAEDE